MSICFKKFFKTLGKKFNSTTKLLTFYLDNLSSLQDILSFNFRILVLFIDFYIYKLKLSINICF